MGRRQAPAERRFPRTSGAGKEWVSRAAEGREAAAMLRMAVLQNGRGRRQAPAQRRFPRTSGAGRKWVSRAGEGCEAAGMGMLALQQGREAGGALRPGWFWYTTDRRRRRGHRGRASQVKRSRSPKISRSRTAVGFGVLTFAGLAEITQRELEPYHPSEVAVFRLRNYDLIVGKVSEASAGRLAGLRTVEDVFYMMGVPVAVAVRRDLGKLDRIVSRAEVLNGVRLKNAFCGPRRRKSPTFNCFVKQDRDRDVRRKQIAERVAARVGSCLPRWRRADPSEIELWGFYVKGSVHVGLRVSDEGMKYRGKAPQQRRGALRPTIAAALALLADPKPGSLVVDPMCGTGTILEEVFHREKAARYAGGDAAQEAVELAGERLAAYGIPIRRWEAKELPFGDAQIDCIVCNLPFGRRYSTGSQNPALYRALLSNWRRKLKAGGRMVLLTADSAALEGGLLGLGLKWRSECKVKVLGVWATIYVVEKGPARRGRAGTGRGRG